jgi:hypothetical protein
MKIVEVVPKIEEDGDSIGNYILNYAVDYVCEWCDSKENCDRLETTGQSISCPLLYHLKELCMIDLSSLVDKYKGE